MKKEKEIEELEEAIDKTIEDMKNVFSFRPCSPKNKNKTIFIPETKIGILRYLFLKNLKEK